MNRIMIKKGSGVVLLALALVAMTFTGCSHFTTTQKDLNYENGVPLREITTKASAFTFWDSRSALANFKASQTDKTQGASVGSLNQESSGTNTAATIKALVDLLNAVK